MGKISRYKKKWAGIIILCFIWGILFLCKQDVYAEDPAWWEDYTYTLDNENHYIKLEKYNGNAAELTVPAKATVEGVEYTTYIEGNYDGYSIWGAKDNLKKLSFDTGIALGDNLYGLFIFCDSLTDIDVSSFDTSNVHNMNSMFERCSGLDSIDLSNFKTSHVSDMGSMFEDCKRLKNIDISNFDTSNVENMDKMFCGCS